ncbi:MAG: hypothetical protein AB7T06_37485 [Kofleriaceae bacterium]
MSDLAYNINGEGFELPETATGWRVRRMKPRGAPEVVYAKDGLPLTIPIESDLEELRRVVDAAGRFRLDAVDDRGRNIEDVPAAYVVVPHKLEDRLPAPPAVEPPAPRGPINGVDSVIAEAMRLNTELAKSVIDRFPEMMQAAAMVLRAADGAGMPARQPRAGEVDDEFDDDDDAAPMKAGFDLNAIVAQVVPMLLAGVTAGKVRMPDLAGVVDWRKAAKPSRATKSIEKSSVIDTSVPENAAAIIPPIDAETMTHFIAVQSALKPEEAALAREVAGNLSAPELHAWFDELKKLTVPQAVQKIRTLIAGNTEAVP